MKLRTERYSEQIRRLPRSGKHIVGQFDEENIVVYQAFSEEIGAWAVKQQQFGGPAYSFSRMSWIKPNFLWMMYRCGWGMKDEGQKCVLAITIRKKHFEEILKEAVHATYDPEFYSSREKWQEKLPGSEVRLQWDPDHDPYGSKMERRAIQLGLRGDILKKFCTEWIVSIEDITGFVLEQHRNASANRLDELIVPSENVYETSIKV